MDRCSWANGSQDMINYHDYEWGVPSYDDNVLFEFLVLEIMQAGLSWATIISKRSSIKDAFSNWDYKKVSSYDNTKIEELMNNKNIIRNRLKIDLIILNAKKFIDIIHDYKSFSNYIWKFVNNKPIINNFEYASNVPSSTKLSKTISDDLKKKGFKFVGPTIVYSFLQAIGVVNDHTKNCYIKKLNSQ
ncbi:DNA-3-methyladenine glycosidase I [Spiroplasma helicoides]|uniref:DNA-3-methyladenine glycosidase I n=1 Tax=Spiroplasma helicoides TaxID=216938 RepID=A0A1B3SLD9_9MOLU|nr:DNA-3-methyladenine glycosylase I [Spiroplasma helicoides]AOG60751.1 DNA-3-methyladenine glycosidase I [Spiroplasma helicoides]